MWNWLFEILYFAKHPELAERISQAALSAADEDKIDAMLDVLENIDEEQAQSMLNSG